MVARPAPGATGRPVARAVCGQGGVTAGRARTPAGKARARRSARGGSAVGGPRARILAQRDAQVGLYRSLLAGKRMLVVLDNASCSDHVLPLLPGSPRSLALVTSRSPLAGLAVAHGARLVSLDTMSAADARDLLAVRLGAARVAGEPPAAEALVELTPALPLAPS